MQQSTTLPTGEITDFQVEVH